MLPIRRMRGEGTTPPGSLPMSDRGAVSSESTTDAAPRPPSHKAPELLRHLEQSLSRHLMFKHLESDEQLEVFQRMFECHFKANDVIIKQGDPGDNFYVVETGKCDIFIAKAGTSQHVLTAGPGDAFGELALMYGSPRAATVIAKTEVKLWALDRDSYRHTLMSATVRKRTQYEGFLEKVPILSPCTKYERTMIADALDLVTFKDGETIMREDEPGDTFYIIVEGKVLVKKSGAVLSELHQSGYFGERALIMNQPRAATIVTVGDVKCARLERDKFTRLLGPCEDILRRNMETYQSVLQQTAST